MNTTTAPRRRPRAVATVLAVVTALLALTAAPARADTRSWAIDADQVEALRIQESGVFSNGDEFYVAQIGFRSRVGVRGSTSAWFQGGLSEVKLRKRGDVRTIPDAMGRVSFPNVTRCSLSRAVDGTCQVEVVGSISVVFESDATPWSTINSLMRSAATQTRTEVAGIIENLKPAHLLAPHFAQQFESELSSAANRIRSQVRPSLLRSIGIWLGSAGDPDDLIGMKVNLFAAVDSSLAAAVDRALSPALADQGVGGALRNRTYTQTFTGDGASYRLTYRVN